MNRNKRPLSSEPPDSPHKKQKLEKKKKVIPQKVPKTPNLTDPDLEELISKFKTPENAIDFLLTNSSLSKEEFFSQKWEKAPYSMQMESPRKELTKIFNYEYLCQFVKDNETSDELGVFELAPERDFLLTKYVDDKKVDAEVDILTEEVLRKSVEENRFGVQINQPQRFVDVLWALMEKLESYFGSLVGSHVCCVPAGTQMAPPQYDDSERFYLQLEGKKTFKVYKPKNELAADFDDDLKDLDLCEEPLMTVTLNVGDVLYLPRGTIFESIADTLSTDIVFYTYQGNNVATFLQQTVGPLIENLSEKFIELRRGLPLGYLPRFNKISAEDYAGMLEKLADAVRKDSEPLLCPEVMLQDFMKFRLPPFQLESSFDPETSEEPTFSGSFSFRDKNHIAWYTKISDDSDSNEADEECSISNLRKQEDELIILSSVRNSRDKHMMIESRILGIEGDMFSLKSHYKKSMETLAAAESPIEYTAFPAENGSGDAIPAMIMLRALFNIGALRVD